MVIRKWKIEGTHSVSADEAGQELDRIYQERGKLDPQDIVDESRPVDAVLHKEFEWDDFKAAESYRKQQARMLVDCIITVVDTPKNKQIETRAYVHVESSYHPLSVVVSEVDKLYKLKLSAFRELKAFRRKYQAISELSPVFDAIDTALEGDVS